MSASSPAESIRSWVSRSRLSLEQVGAKAEEVPLILLLPRSLAVHPPKTAGRATEVGEPSDRSSFAHNPFPLSSPFAQEAACRAECRRRASERHKWLYPRETGRFSRCSCSSN